MKRPKIRPVRDKVLVRLEDRVTRTAGGLYIPDTAKQDQSWQGTVEATGNHTDACPDCGRHNGAPTGVQVGDRVLIAKYAKAHLPNFRVEDDELERLVVRPEHILGVMQ